VDATPFRIWWEAEEEIGGKKHNVADSSPDLGRVQKKKA